MEIEEILMDHNETSIKAFFRKVGGGLANEAKILVSMEGLKFY